MTKMVSCGSTAAATARISSKSAASWRWRPLVSTMIRSHFCSRNRRTPSAAMRAGSVSV